MSMASVDCNFINQECVLKHTTVFATRIDFIQIAYDKSVNRGKNKWYVVHTTETTIRRLSTTSAVSDS